MTSQAKLRRTFNAEAELYDKARPHYPPELFDALLRVTALPPRAKLLEIGPGTGQATQPLAERGYSITAIELGKELAAIARRKLQQYPNVEVIAGAFEDADLPAQAYDLVFSATAFHWLKPEAKFAKPHHTLRDNGHLAVIHTNHVSDEQGDAFFYISHPIYEKYFPSSKERRFQLPRITDLTPPKLDTQLFELTHFECFPLVMHYTTETFIELISTYSPTLALSDDKRALFLKEIAHCVDTQFNGTLIRHFAMSLAVAKKLH
jgi:SAM-dependent methyltransferase